MDGLRTKRAFFSKTKFCTILVLSFPATLLKVGFFIIHVRVVSSSGNGPKAIITAINDRRVAPLALSVTLAVAVVFVFVVCGANCFVSCRIFEEMMAPSDQAKQAQVRVHILTVAFQFLVHLCHLSARFSWMVVALPLQN